MIKSWDFTVNILLRGVHGVVEAKALHVGEKTFKKSNKVNGTDFNGPRGRPKEK